PDPTLISKLKFQQKFWRSQELILEKFDEIAASVKRKFYVVSPPGSGKTIVGLEIIKRLGTNALVLTPNTSTQAQWIDKIKLFLDPELEISPTNIGTIFAESRVPITVMTYQRFSMYDNELELINEKAEELWIKENERELTKKTKQYFGQEKFNSAKDFLNKLKEEKNESYIKELKNYIKKIRHKILTDKKSEFSPKDILHPNTLKIIEQLKRKGIGVIVLDECHHLTSIWAFITRYLIEEFGQPFVVGLTATPPIEETEKQKANGEKSIYELLFGEVDIQIPTPAAVKQKNLAAYQDLLFLTNLTKEDKVKIENEYEQVEEILNTEIDFADIPSPAIWVKKKRKRKHLLNSLRGRHQLLEEYHAFVKSSFDDLSKQEQEFVKKIGKVLNRISNASKEVFLRSKGKINAVVQILEHEFKSIKNHLRAAIVYDEYQQDNMKELLLSLSKHPTLGDLEAILVVNKAIFIDADLSEEIVSYAKKFTERLKLDFKINVEIKGEIAEINGYGRDWNTGTYILFLTYLFEKGATRCFIGSRSLLGEGWDSKRLNCLIDLTSTSAYQTTVQVKGRAYRLDEHLPKKVANNWEVAVIDYTLPEGFCDFERIVKKHEHFYSISDDGVIEKGIGHIYPSIVKEIEEFKVDIDDFNKIMKLKAEKRSKCYELWDVGGSYDNVEAIALNIKFKESELVVPYLKDTTKVYIKDFKPEISRTAKVFAYKTFMSDIIRSYFTALALLNEYLELKNQIHKKLKYMVEKTKHVQVSQRTGGYVRLNIMSTEEKVRDYAKSIFTLEKCNSAVQIAKLKSGKGLNIGDEIEISGKKMKKAKICYLLGLPFLNKKQAKRFHVLWTRLSNASLLVSSRDETKRQREKQSKEIVIEEKIVWM
ncbi:MAG: DEAD/DEAH box helicase, partial [Candidatus Heimdallarchaeaceae archaeon]